MSPTMCATGSPYSFSRYTLGEEAMSQCTAERPEVSYCRLEVGHKLPHKTSDGDGFYAKESKARPTEAIDKVRAERDAWKANCKESDATIERIRKQCTCGAAEPVITGL